MASVLPSVIDESLLQCRLCCRPATDPRLLPCLHVFCRTCLLRHVARLRHAAAVVAQRQSAAAVAQNEPEDLPASLEPAVDKFASSSSKHGDADSSAGGEARPPPPPPVKSPSLAEDDEVVYEIPRPDDDDYEDVDSDRTYANDVIVSGGHVMLAGKLGYAVMAGRPVTSSSAASSSPQVRRKTCTSSSSSSPSSCSTVYADDWCLRSDVSSRRRQSALIISQSLELSVTCFRLRQLIVCGFNLSNVQCCGCFTDFLNFSVLA